MDRDPEYKQSRRQSEQLASFELAVLRLARAARELGGGAAEKLGYQPGCMPASSVQQNRRNDGCNSEVERTAATCAQGVTMEAEAMSRGRRKSPGKQIVQGQIDEPKAARAVA